MSPIAILPRLSALQCGVLALSLLWVGALNAHLAPREVVFIDTGVADWQVLRDGVKPGMEVVLLDAGADGLAQMAAWVQGRSGYDAIHVLSHGSPGTVHLGGFDLNRQTLAERAGELAAIGAMLNEDGNLLIYGCNIAAGEAGQAFVANLAQTTGADVAASNDITGSLSKGGNWTLEHTTGFTQAGASLSLINYQFTLPTEDFEILSAGAKAFTSNGINFSLTNYLEVARFDTFGSGGGNFFVDTGYRASRPLGNVGSFQVTNAYTFELTGLHLWTSANGGDNQVDAIVTLTGTRASGGTVTSSFLVEPTGLSGNDWDTTNNITAFNGIQLTELSFSIDSDANYIAIDKLSFNATPVSVAPIFDVSPATSNVTSTAFDLSASIDEAGTIYYVVVADGAIAPTATEVKNGTASGGGAALKSGNSAAGSSPFTANFSVSGLTASTAYDIYVVAEDNESTPNLMAAATKVDVTTSTATPTSPYLVDNTGDTSDGNYSAGNLTLREAAILAQAGEIIQFANSINNGTITLGSPITLAANVTFDASPLTTLTITGSTITLNGALTVTNGPGDTLTIASVLAGSGSLTKVGAGTLTLSGNNTLTGALTVSGGTLAFGANGNISTTSSLMLDGGILASTAVVSYAKGITLGGSGGTFDLSNGSITLSGVVSGTGAMTIGGTSGGNALALNGANTYTGGTTLDNGILTVGTDTAFGTGTLTINGAKIRNMGSGTTRTLANDLVLGGTFTMAGVGALSFTGDVDLGGANRTINNSITTADLTFGGVVSNGSLTIDNQAGGTTVLSGTNTYANTTITRGTLSVTGDANLGSGTVALSGSTAILKVTGSTVTIDNALTLGSSGGTISNANAVTLSGAITGTGILTKTGAGTLTLSGTNTYTGGTTVSAGTLEGTTASLQGAITNNATVEFAQATAGTYSGAMSGTGSLTKTGAGALTLSGANTHAGTTTLSAGTLLIQGSLAGSVTTANGTTLGATGGAGTTGNAATGALTIASGGILATEINGVTAGTGYDQVNVTGTVDISNATLALTLGFTPAVGNSFILINKQSSGTITGTFTTVTVGGTPVTVTSNRFTTGGLTYEISYSGGTGNDLTLTVVDTTPPTVQSVAAPTNGTYKIGDNLDFTATFSEAVTISGGTPSIALTLDTGGTVQANLNGTVTSSTTGTFRYTVISGNLDANGISAAATITANGATIRDAANNAMTTFTFTAPNTTGVLVDGVPPDKAAANPITANDADISGTYTENDTLTLTFTEAVDATKITIGNLTVNNGHSLGTSASVSPTTGTASTFTLTLGTSPTIVTTDTLTLTAANVVDQAGNTASADVVFTVPALCTGASLAVTTTADSGAGSLRQAITDLCVDGTITFDATAFAAPQTITLASTLALNKNLTLDGTGRKITVSGNSAVRAFAIASGAVTLKNLTVIGGNAANGGGLSNNGGTVTVRNSAFTGNTATSTGGAIYNASGTLTVINSTFATNSATTSGASLSVAGGAVTVINSSFAGTAAGGEIAQTGGAVSLTSTLIDNAALTCAGTITNGGHNLDRGTGCGFGVASNSQSGVNPLLGALGDYGGDTQTLPLLPGSPAINAGDATVCADAATVNSLDQRGIARPTACDIGAFESRGFTLAKTGGDNQSATVSTAFTDPLAVSVTATGAGEPVDGGQVTFTAPVSGASAGLAGSPATIAGGSASINATANATAGGYQVAASAAGATAINFSLTNNSLPSPVNGACGSANGQVFTSAPTSNLCGVGTASAVLSNAGTFTWTCAGSNGGTDASCSATRAYTVTPSAGANGSLTPNTPQTITYNQTTAFIVTPNTGYQIDAVTGCNGALSGATYTTGAIADNCVVTASFRVRKATTTALTGHSPDPALTGQAVTVTYAVTPATGPGVPTGPVTINADTGETCTAPVETGACDLTFATAGQKTLTATYSGDTTFAGSTSAPQTQQVDLIAQGTVPGGSGTITVRGAVSDGTAVPFASARFLAAQGDPASPPDLPPGVSFPYGLFAFTVTNLPATGTPASVTFTLTYPDPLPAGTRYWKYGPTTAQPTPHWYVLPAIVAGNQITFTVTDGGPGDSDLSVNGAITDPGGPGAGVADIPTLGEWALLLLGLALVGLAWQERRRRAWP